MGTCSGTLRTLNFGAVSSDRLFDSAIVVKQKSVSGFFAVRVYAYSSSSTFIGCNIGGEHHSIGQQKV